MMRVAIAAVLAIVLAALLAAPASAWRKASPSEKTAVANAMNVSVECVDVEMSTERPQPKGLTAVAWPGIEDGCPDTIAWTVLRRPNASTPGRWVVVMRREGVWRDCMKFTDPAPWIAADLEICSGGYEPGRLTRICANTYGGDVIGAYRMPCRKARAIVRTWARRYVRDGKLNRSIGALRCRYRIVRFEGGAMRCDRPRDRAYVAWYVNVAR